MHTVITHPDFGKADPETVETFDATVNGTLTRFVAAHWGPEDWYVNLPQAEVIVSVTS